MSSWAFKSGGLWRGNDKRGSVSLSPSKTRAQRPCPPCFDGLSMTPVLSCHE